MINSLRLRRPRRADPPARLRARARDQRELLAAAGHAGRRARPSAPPWLLKTVAPLRHPAEVMVLIDADMIATRSLGELIDRAARGAGGRVRERHRPLRPEWGELLGLGEVRRQPYVSLGARLRWASRWASEVLELMDERQDQVDFERTFWRANAARLPVPLRRPGRAQRDPRQPPTASCSSRCPSAWPRTRPSRPAAGRRASLRCAYPDGTQPYLSTTPLPSPGSSPRTTASTPGC